MQLAANDLEWQVKQAEATLADLKSSCRAKRSTNSRVVASAQSDLQQAALQKEKEEQLGKMQLESELSVKLAVAKWEQSANKYKMEKQKLDIQQESVDAQLGSAKVQVDKLRAAYTLKKQQVADLTIKRGINGRMQEMTLQVGQRVKPGDVLAKDRAALETEGGAENRRDAGEGHPARAKSGDRHAQRDYSGSREPDRRIYCERNADG